VWALSQRSGTVLGNACAARLCWAAQDPEKIVDPPTGPVRLQMPPAVAEALAREVGRTDALWARLDAVMLRPDLPGSAATSEKRDRLGAFAYDLAATYLRAALDHTRAWQTLLRAGEVPSFAYLSLLRTAHESAFVALWLMEPGVPAEERRARGVAAQLADYEERHKLEADMGITAIQPPGRTAAQRRTELLADATRHGLTRVTSKGKAVVTTPPSTVELFIRFEPVPPGTKGSFLYRLYSGYAHAKQWAVTLGAQRVAPFDETGRTLALAAGNDTATLWTLWTTRRTINAVERAVAAYEALHQPPSAARG